MAVVLFAFEVLTVMAGKWFPTQSYTLSPTTLMLCIVMMRWDGFAAIHAVVGGLAFCITAGAEPRQFLVYCIGNCFALLGLVVLKLCGKEKVRSRIPFSVAFVVIVFTAVQAGRGVVSMILGAPAETIVTFLATDSLAPLKPAYSRG